MFLINHKLLQLTAVLVVFTFARFTNAQQNNNSAQFSQFEKDKCGFYLIDSLNHHDNHLNNWGYSYDSLLTDLQLWKTSPYVLLDSIGLSVQGRVLWRLIITNHTGIVSSKRTIHIHARTHPQETEGFWVTKDIIDTLLSESILAQKLREKFIYYIIPMFNPDGVELNLPRRNANNVDLESNWNTFPHQPEVQALKSHFISLMESENPIEIMLNMHSSSLCKRYFVYHDSAGTSSSFALMQQNYINGIRYYYPTGIEPWNYFVSWTGGTPLQYPESWFWTNHGESVMALTYEDMYQCAGTGNFDITASALLNGTNDYLDAATNVEFAEQLIPGEFKLYQNYPNPFNPSTTISFSIPIHTNVTIDLYDVLGNRISTLLNEDKSAGVHKIDFVADGLSSGVYFYSLRADNLSKPFFETRKLIYLK